MNHHKKETAPVVRGRFETNSIHGSKRESEYITGRVNSQRFTNVNTRRRIPRSAFPLFKRVAMARNYADACQAVQQLAGYLLCRGQSAHQVAGDLMQLASAADWRLAVIAAPIVHDLVVRGVAHG